METQVENVFKQLKLIAKANGCHFSAHQNALQPSYTLLLSNGPLQTTTIVTREEIEAASGPDLLLGYLNHMIEAITGGGKVAGVLKVEPPQAESLEELYANADWDDIVKNNKKGKPKPQLTATQLEKAKKHGGFMAALNAANEKMAKDLAIEMFKESPLMAHLKAK